MKLLSPSQLNEVRGQEKTRDILRAQEIDKATKKIYLNLANAEAEFNEMLARHRKKWAAEEREYLENKKSLIQEIKDLESKKSDLTSYLARLLEREENIDSLTEKIEDRLADLSEKESDLKDREDRLLISEEGNSLQRRLTLEGGAKWNDAIKKISPSGISP